MLWCFFFFHIFFHRCFIFLHSSSFLTSNVSLSSFFPLLIHCYYSIRCICTVIFSFPLHALLISLILFLAVCILLFLFSFPFHFIFPVFSFISRDFHEFLSTSHPFPLFFHSSHIYSFTPHSAMSALYCSSIKHLSLDPLFLFRLKPFILSFVSPSNHSLHFLACHTFVSIHPTFLYPFVLLLSDHYLNC